MVDFAKMRRDAAREQEQAGAEGETGVICPKCKRTIEPLFSERLLQSTLHENRAMMARIQAAHDLIDGYTDWNDTPPQTDTQLVALREVLGFDGVKLKGTP